MSVTGSNIKKEGIIEYLERLRPEIDGIIEKYFPRKINEKWLEFVFGKPRYNFNPKAVEGSLIKPIWNFLDRGGKRWRPALFLLVTEAVGGKVEKVKDLAIVPELSHEGSIIVDDIEDEGELRRGKPALHRIFGVDMALNAGNFLYFLPLLILAKNKNKFKKEFLLKAYETFVQEMVNLSLGQGTDIFWHKGKTTKINEKDYLQMCAFKTGCLSRMAAKMAVILAEKDEVLAEKVGRVAEAIGIGFQIQDDILDITLAGKEREKFGKSFGNDIKEGKRTLMVIHALKNANSKDKKKLLQILDKHTDNLKERKEAIDIINKYRGVEYAKKIARTIIKDAWKDADRLLPESKAKNKLFEFTNFLIERNA